MERSHDPVWSSGTTVVLRDEDFHGGSKLGGFSGLQLGNGGGDVLVARAAGATRTGPLVDELRRTTGAAVLCISHDLAAVDDVSDQVMIWLRSRIVEQGPTRAGTGNPQDRRIRLLLFAEPHPGWDPDHAVAARTRFRES